MGLLYNIPSFRPLETLFPNQVELEFIEILQELLVFNPSDRKTAKDLLSNPIFNSIRKPTNEEGANFQVQITITLNMKCE